MRLIRPWSVGARARFALTTLALLAAPAAAQAQQATITGRVTATGTQEPLSDSRVSLVGTGITVATNSEGRYTLRGVPAGAVEVRVIRVGYTEQKKPVTVSAGGTATLDFLMVPSVVQLQEIVTTATGQQRRVELGNAVTTLGDVTTKVETEPVANLADLMVAKSPGVTVLPGAMTGAAPVIRIRGLGSLATAGSGISNSPIYVIDGVRMNAGAISLNTGGTNASFLNDLDPNEIEDIEIVKGPSAATLYGTDAANGVIVITTKKGRAGTTRWTYYGEGGAVDDRNKYPTDYASWGHVTALGATANLPAGTLERCTLVSESQGTCGLDSLTSFSVLMNPATTAIHLGHRDAYGGNVSGGSDAVRFFMSGDLQEEIGPIHMPGFAQGTLDSLGAGRRDEWTNPEQFQQQSLRTNLSASLNPKVDLNINAGFSNTNQRLPQVDNNTFSFIYSALNNPGFNHTSTTGIKFNEVGTLGEYKNGYGGFSPAQIFQMVNENGTQRFIGSANAAWRPFAWMQNEATTGLDLANNDNLSLNRFNEGPNSGTNRQGGAFATQTNLRNFSSKLTSNSTWQVKPSLNLKTTVGADYTNLENDQVASSGINLPPGAQNVGQGATRSGSNTEQTANKTLGLYAQEQASIRDRLFLTVAARTDQNSSFGTQFQRVVYPKASISWILSDEKFFPKFDWMNNFRLRSAYGASGVQPGGTVALQTFGSATTNVSNGVPGSTTAADTPGLLAAALGNPKLKPERSAEFEGGFETAIFTNRIHIDATYYNKKTSDALISLPISASAGPSALSVLANDASTQNTGYELTVNSTILDRRQLGWDITVAASHNSNKILKLGNDLAGKPLPTIGTATNRDSAGASINGLYARPFTFNDANHDGIITPDEVTVSPNFAYYGYSLPRDIVSITNGFDLFNRHLRLSALTDYKGGYSLYNQSGQFFTSNFSTNPSQNLKSSSLADQARTVANSSAKSPNTVAGYLENGQFWKLREVSAALTLPNTVASRLHARDAQLVFSARNLHTWTKYTGIDPESNYSTGDIQTDFATTPPPTYFIIRANLHY